MKWELIDNPVDRTNIRDRILRQCEEVVETGCWRWTGRLGHGGYGRMFVRRTHLGIANTVGAHRASYFAFHGPPPSDMDVDHICFVPACVNPEHLRLLAPAENRIRRRPRPARVVTACRHGHAYTPENSYISASGSRWCRVCVRRKVAAYKARKKLVASS